MSNNLVFLFVGLFQCRVCDRERQTDRQRASQPTSEVLMVMISGEESLVVFGE